MSKDPKEPTLKKVREEMDEEALKQALKSLRNAVAHHPAGGVPGSVHRLFRSSDPRISIADMLVLRSLVDDLRAAGFFDEDVDAVGRDWEAVGADLYKALDRVMDEQFVR